MLDILFTTTAFEQYNDWLILDKVIYKKVTKINYRNSSQSFRRNCKTRTFKTRPIWILE